MERLFRSFKAEWLLSGGYMSAQEAHRDICHYLMHRYNWIQPHQFNIGLVPAVAEEELNAVSEISCTLHYGLVVAGGVKFHAFSRMARRISEPVACELDGRPTARGQPAWIDAGVHLADC